MIHQKEQNRYWLNLLYAAPVKRGLAEVIEDIVPIYNIGVELDVPQTIKKAYLPLSGETLPVEYSGGRTHFLVPKLECHTSVVLEY